MIQLFPILVSLALAQQSFSTPVTKRFTGVLIYSGRRPDKCLSSTFIRGPRPGTGVDLVDCSSASTWDINPGAGAVKLSPDTLILDAGYNPGNGGYLGLEYPEQGKAAQNWYLTGDNRIAITGGNQCLDDDGSRLQTWQCTTGNTNQIFFTRPPSGGGGGGSSGGNNPVQPPDIPYATIYQDPDGYRKRLHALARSDLCMTVLGGQARDGANVGVTYCVANEDGRVGLQFWDFSAAYSASGGRIYLANNRDFCLTTPNQDGGGTTLVRCDQARNWSYNKPNGRFFVSGTSVCLDVRAESRAGNESPINSLRTLQSWLCYDNSGNQNFFVLP